MPRDAGAAIKPARIAQRVNLADSTAEDGGTLAPSKRRAGRVSDTGHGSDRLTLEGRGESSPVAPNTTPAGQDDPEGRAKNRRVEFVFPAGMLSGG